MLADSSNSHRACSTSAGRQQWLTQTMQHQRFQTAVTDADHAAVIDTDTVVWHKAVIPPYLLNPSNPWAFSAFISLTTSVLLYSYWFFILYPQHRHQKTFGVHLCSLLLHYPCTFSIYSLYSAHLFITISSSLNILSFSSFTISSPACSPFPLPLSETSINFPHNHFPIAHPIANLP